MLRYKDTGVDESGARALARIFTEHARQTHDERVRFAGAPFAALLQSGPDSVLAASADGVGSKALIARAMRSFAVLGHDAVAVNVNDLAARGARPLFFLDYLALDAVDEDAVRAIAAAMTEACKSAGCTFLGGETALLPDQLRSGALDVVGFAVGLLTAGRLDHEGVREGDAVMALASSGLHANGISLARHAAERAGIAFRDYVPCLGARLGDALLTPTPIYVDSVLSAINAGGVRRAAHVSGGGLYGRAETLVPPGLGIEFRRGTWNEPAIIDWLRHAGPVDEGELLRTVNMGIGFLVVAAPDSVPALNALGFAVVGVVTHDDAIRLVG